MSAKTISVRRYPYRSRKLLGGGGSGDTAASGAASREGLAVASALCFFGDLCAAAVFPLFVAAAGLLITHFEAQAGLRMTTSAIYGNKTPYHFGL